MSVLWWLLLAVVVAVVVMVALVLVYRARRSGSVLASRPTDRGSQ